jgi:FeS assembly SUF system protein
MDAEALKQRAIATLRTVYDPEIPVDIYELGLVYKIECGEAASLYVQLTLTAPNCPVAGSLPAEVERKLRAIPGVGEVKLELTFDPPWTRDRMSDAARLALGMDDILPLRSYGA